MLLPCFGFDFSLSIAWRFPFEERNQVSEWARELGGIVNFVENRLYLWHMAVDSMGGSYMHSWEDLKNSESVWMSECKQVRQKKIVNEITKTEKKRDIKTTIQQPLVASLWWKSPIQM